MKSIKYMVVATALCLTACAQTSDVWNRMQTASPFAKAEDATQITLVKSSFKDMPGWGSDNLADSLLALQTSCAPIKLRAPTQKMQMNGVGGTAKAWQDMCHALDGLDESGSVESDPTIARQFIETWFDPYQIKTPQGEQGLFTGYYEASLKGSLTQQAGYQTPLYQRPPDLVMVELDEFRPQFQNERIAGRVENGVLKPYADRAAIDQGALRGRNLELLWVDNPYDAFFLQIQGSGRVVMPDGNFIRLGYDGQNGYPYTAIGAELVKRGALSKDQVSMQTIRQWLTAHPSEAPALLAKNRSYVFFKVLDQDNPQGASGVGLTPLRSVAVDPRFVPYGAPLWVNTTRSAGGASTPFQRLLVAQDTGGAIRGPVRGDVFWGYGAEAEQAAGTMKSRGNAWMLLPKNTDSVMNVTLPSS